MLVSLEEFNRFIGEGGREVVYIEARDGVLSYYDVNDVLIGQITKKVDSDQYYKICTINK